MSKHETTRRKFLKRLGMIGAVMSVPGRGIYASQSEFGKPNIVFILADDMGYGDLACQNPETKIPTPNLDRLAETGIRFTDAHSPSAVCSPTRYGILTGRYCWRTRLKSGVLGPYGMPLIEPDRLTVASMLKKHGYATGCIGKWHLGMKWTLKNGKEQSPWANHIDDAEIDLTKTINAGPLTVGFDYYFGTDVPNYPPYCFIENTGIVGDVPDKEKPESMFGNPGRMQAGWKLENIMPALTEKAVQFINDHARRKPRQPFFLYFSLTAPHTPIAPAPEFVGKSEAAAYGDFVYQVDWSVGQVVDALKNNRLDKNTLIVFISDNGSPGKDGTGMSGELNSVRKYGHNPSYIYRGIKADTWEGGHRVPFIASWQGHIVPGSVSEELICQTDLMATVAAILGETLPHNAGEDSYDILPVLLGKKLNKPIREAVVHHSSNGMFGIRQGRWKLILGLGSGGFSEPKLIKPKPGEPEGQLYDLQTDPREKNNLWAERPDIVKRLTALLDKYKKEGRSTL